LFLLLAGCSDRGNAVSGTIEVDEAHVGPRSGGRVEKILAWEGDRLHEGQDIFAQRGTPVLSATDGYVVRIGENSLGGQTVSILGAGGRSYYYAHLDSYAANLAIGDHVTTQTILGYVGNTGNAAGGPTHLHFGVYAREGALNPLPLLTDRPVEKKTAKTPGIEPVRKRR